ncbi:unnamed protein product [Adineta ricciae]|uniref:Carrier domain-containing protein n=2 Tax=Adineta ricciae TaxID=249248 RepID=A0A815RTH8_ADIRI|nr:unnamed protein product [Adineta ricciae]
MASFAQKRLWTDEKVRFNESMNKQISVYNELLIYKLSSNTTFSLDRLRHALALIVEKHVILCTALIYGQDGLIQKILPISENLYNFEVTNIVNDIHLKQILYDEETNRSLFDLEKGRVFRCHILCHSSNNDDGSSLKQNDIILFNFHHIAFDGSSIQIFINDLRQALITSELHYNYEDNITYLDYAQYELLEDWSNTRQYWKNVLTIFDNAIHAQNSSVRTGKGHTITFDLNRDFVISLNHFISQSNLTLFQAGLAAFFAFLFKMSSSQQLDLCAGIVVANRSQYQLQNVIGFFANTLPFCLTIDPHESFIQLCQRIQETWLDILPHIHLPYQEIVKLNPKLGSSFLRIFFLVETKMDSAEHNIELGEGTTLNTMDRKVLAGNIAKFDMTCTLHEYRQKETITVSFNASLDLYDESTISIMANRLKNIFEQIFSISSISQFSLVLPHELGLIRALNNTLVNDGQISCIHHAFTRQVTQHQQKLAVELDDQSLTYSELLYYAQILSLDLMSKYHIVPGEIICQCVERSLSMVIGIMTIEMVGGVYCPLSPRDPQHRLHALVQETQTRLVLVHYLTKLKFNDDIISLDIASLLIGNDRQNDIDVNRLSSVVVTHNSTAYIIFTSGSTGTPKAAQVRHRNFIELIRSLNCSDVISEKDTVAQMARCSFDAHIRDIMGTLVIGATLIMLHPGGNMDFDYLVHIMKEKTITWITTVPTILHNFFTFLHQINCFNATKCLRSVGSGGEACTAQLAHLILSTVPKTCRVWNLYGPAETTVDCTAQSLLMTTLTGKIPIGKPLPNYKSLVLDEFLQSVAIDQEGELLVGGVGVFIGYLGRADLTAKVFIQIDSELFYRTGDLVRMDSKGLLHYIGRKDFQIKLRGQRIELGEIELCLLKTSISACIITKWGTDHLVAYVQKISDTDEKQLHKHCQSHLPPHMIPSFFVILDKLPLNANGKIDRKLLPQPDFKAVNKTELTDLTPLTSLEGHLQRIFSDVFHNESPCVDASFREMGGTSLDVIRALWLIRQEICTNIDVDLLFANPSIRQLAQAIEPLLVTYDDSTLTSTTAELKEEYDRSMPCLYIEMLGILLLICQWILPIWLTYQLHPLFILLFVPAFHLLSYVVCQRLLVYREEIGNKADKLFSWYYYRWWFLNSMWSINNSYWLKHLLGTSFYNSYLRLCGAKIGDHSHIYTVLIDAPWLIEVGDFTFIGVDVVLSNLSYQDRTYELHRIQIGSYCSIGIRSVLYENVFVEDCVYIEPMSSISGLILASKHHISCQDRLLSFSQTMYQLTCLLTLLFIHSLLLLLAYELYTNCFTLLLPLSISLALSWLMWSLTSLFTMLLLLKFIVGPSISGYYSLNSQYYLHKLWLRQLIITSFHHSLAVIPPYDTLAGRGFLSAHIEDDVKFAEFTQILYFPTDLLNIERGVTTFAGTKLASFEMTKEGLCYLDEIHIGANTNLTNWCTIMPGTRLSPKTMIGSLTLIVPDTVSKDTNRVLLGIPAREMPFVLVDTTSFVDGLSSSSNSVSMHTLMFNCLHFFLYKSAFIILYLSLPVAFSPLLHIMIVCVVYRFSIAIRNKRTQFTFSEVINCSQQFFRLWMFDFFIFVGPYLSGTQFLVFFYRALGAQIGCDVILPHISCLTDPDLATIGDHVRLQRGAHVQCHTFEQRVLKFAPVNVNHSSVLMNNTLVLSGAILHGRNRILPWTLVMKNDQLPPNTNWSGVPAQQIL